MSWSTNTAWRWARPWVRVGIAGVPLLRVTPIVGSPPTPWHPQIPPTLFPTGEFGSIMEGQLNQDNCVLKVAVKMMKSERSPPPSPGSLGTPQVPP